MLKSTITKAVETLPDNFTPEELAKAVLIQSLKEVDAEALLSDVDSDVDGSTATRETEIEIVFSNDDYINLKIKGFYNVEEEPSTHDYPGSYEEEFEGWELVEIVDNVSTLTEKEIELNLAV